MPIGVTLALLPVAGAAPDLATLQEAWERDAATIATHGRGAPFTLDATDLALLSEGGTVSRRLDTPEGAFALGAVWLDVPIASAWVASQDAKDRPLSTSTRHTWLPGDDPVTRSVHMVLALPWPLADRQWVNVFHTNRDLYEQSGGRVWQRSWTVGDPATAPASDPQATWLTTNDGAWTMFPAGGGTVAVFGVRTVLGGSIPTGIVQSWALTSLKGILRHLGELAATAPAHYGPAHEVVYDPGGTSLPPGLAGAR